ncbi:hypothetical protein SAMN04487996_101309 [Dyadobacter soli]|uniref:Lipoprotein n=1 Tax=Dyadobacter soli TaxID=659014 RepID=A0A1G6VS23_9BACT|nr:hypothetical protein [Dyadobacter soli]SDD55636.1 hypothetical protein SAMN04487996_101309 [Dyadobacter soli]
MNKFTPLRSTLFLVVMLFAFACTDHSMPSPPTLETLTTTMNCHDLFTYRLNVVESGTMPVVEYGIVYSASNPLNPTPTVESNTKVIFTDTFTDGQKTKVGNPDCASQTYYRAYAILDGGTVVYGNIIHFSND